MKNKLFKTFVGLFIAFTASTLFPNKDDSFNYVRRENASYKLNEGNSLNEVDKLQYQTLDELKGGKKIGVITGTIHDKIVQERIPDCQVIPYKSYGDGILALENKKIEGLVYDSPVLQFASSSRDGLGIIPENIINEEYHLVTPKTENGIALAAEFNEWLVEYKSSGRAQEAYDYWISDAEAKIFNYDALPSTNGTIKVGTFYEARPAPFLYNGNNTGFPNEVIYEFCKAKSYGIKLIPLEIDSFISSVSTEKIDIAISFISRTDERSERVTFTDTFIKGGIGILVRKANYKSNVGFFKKIADSFRNTFITEARWKTIFKGLLKTLLITIFGFILANLLGALFCAMDMSKNKVLKGIYNVYSYFIQGTPIVVIMMILFYIIFGKTDLPGELVAVIGFGLVYGSGLAQTFKSGINSVDKGQKEAALALGFTRKQAFIGITFPQAFRNILPSYASNLIDLLKATSIVGYIAVIDLTKAGDIIRSATYEAFFPLIAIALIYLGITVIILTIMKHIQSRLSKRKVKTEEAK